tara:strand:- start:63 stop:194 length:132 start_codon:yes stop_codon:yes gene_type:complete
MGTERMMFLNEAHKARARRARVKAAKLDKQKGELCENYSKGKG